MPLLGRERGTQVYRELDEHPDDEQRPGRGGAPARRRSFFATSDALEDRVREVALSTPDIRGIVLDCEGSTSSTPRGPRRWMRSFEGASAAHVTLRLARVKPARPRGADPGRLRRPPRCGTPAWERRSRRRRPRSPSRARRSPDPQVVATGELACPGHLVGMWRTLSRGGPHAEERDVTGPGAGCARPARGRCESPCAPRRPGDLRSSRGSPDPWACSRPGTTPQQGPARRRPGGWWRRLTFCRGAAKIMSNDLAQSRTPASRSSCAATRTCRTSASSPRPSARSLFDLNDFDETLPGPFEYDVKRMAASFTIAARNNGFRQVGSRRAITRGWARLLPRRRSQSSPGYTLLAVWYFAPDRAGPDGGGRTPPRKAAVHQGALEGRTPRKAARAARCARPRRLAPATASGTCRN